MVHFEESVQIFANEIEEGQLDHLIGLSIEEVVAGLLAMGLDYSFEYEGCCELPEMLELLAQGEYEHGFDICIGGYYADHLIGEFDGDCVLQSIDYELCEWED